MQDQDLTPMMRQYHAVKQETPDALLLFRLGDFYELFFEDAVTASRELEITLTARLPETVLFSSVSMPSFASAPPFPPSNELPARLAAKVLATIDAGSLA